MQDGCRITRTAMPGKDISSVPICILPYTSVTIQYIIRAAVLQTSEMMITDYRTPECATKKKQPPEPAKQRRTAGLVYKSAKELVAAVY